MDFKSAPRMRPHLAQPDYSLAGVSRPRGPSVLRPTFRQQRPHMPRGGLTTSVPRDINTGGGDRSFPAAAQPFRPSAPNHANVTGYGGDPGQPPLEIGVFNAEELGRQQDKYRQRDRSGGQRSGGRGPSRGQHPRKVTCVFRDFVFDFIGLVEYN